MCIRVASQILTFNNIVNIYDEGDCIPPHIDNHEFVRPFCTVSFLSECNIVFTNILHMMDESKRPVGSVPEPDLQGLRPLANDRPEPNKSMQSSPGSYSREPAVHRQDNGTRMKWPDRRSLEPRNSGPTQRAPMNWRKVI
ncbi:hypothetical protein LIER_44101 [Lithospermum erythrorhizon]|uniref:Uncharacterized protein n=1 Tax=Lithospermum erythrorhizon TaxID=34254 RepID=A0AAV3PJ27_LITER